ncbi:MAG: ABC transporter permease [Alcanivorax sp.]
MDLTPLTRRRLSQFRANKRGYWSFWIFLFLLFITTGAELVANDKPIMMKHNGQFYFPVFVNYAETEFGGDFETEAEYRDEFVQELILGEDGTKGWMLWPPIPFSYDTINYDLKEPAPTAPDEVNWLGTDDQGRDVAARVIYGFRLSVYFGLILTGLSAVIGVFMGAVQGYYGGTVDLILQRITEVWASMPYLYIVIIFAAIFTPGFWTLLLILLMFKWLGLVDLVRAEFLRARNFDYVRAAGALGISNGVIMWRHVLPNAMVATITYLPFILTACITSLTALDFLGLGMPPGSPSLGELLAQGKNNLQAPWLGITGFLSLAVMLTLLTFIGEAVRDAFDPRKTTL